MIEDALEERDRPRDEPAPRTREEWADHLGAPVRHYHEGLRRLFYNMAAPAGPECWCGSPSAHECGACVDHQPSAT